MTIDKAINPVSFGFTIMYRILHNVMLNLVSAHYDLAFNTCMPVCLKIMYVLDRFYPICHYWITVTVRIMHWYGTLLIKFFNQKIFPDFKAVWSNSLEQKFLLKWQIWSFIPPVYHPMKIYVLFLCENHGHVASQ